MIESEKSESACRAHGRVLARLRDIFSVALAVATITLSLPASADGAPLDELIDVQVHNVRPRIPAGHFVPWPTQAMRTHQVIDIASSELPIITTGHCAMDRNSSDFVAEMERLAKTGKGRTVISREYLYSFFAKCSLESAEKLLVDSGFTVGRDDPNSSASERQRKSRRLALAEKTFETFRRAPGEAAVGSLNCRIILREKDDGSLDVEGFFYIDAP